MTASSSAYAMRMTLTHNIVNHRTVILVTFTFGLFADGEIPPKHKNLFCIIRQVKKYRYQSPKCIVPTNITVLPILYKTFNDYLMQIDS